MIVLEWLTGIAVILCFPLWQRRVARRHAHSPAWPEADASALGMTLACAMPLLALTGSPGAAGGCGMLILILLERADNVKRSVLREPVVLSDILLLRQIGKFPVFYFSFLTPWNLVLVAAFVAAAAAVCGQFLPSPPLSPRLRVAFAATPLAVALFAVRFFSTPRFAVRWARFFRRFPVSHDANRDAGRYGIVGCAFLHGIWFLAFRRAIAYALAPGTNGVAPLCRWRNVVPPGGGPLPHVVVVQAESFVRLRRICPEIGGDWTANFDRLAKDGLAGRLATDTFGAYTVRTEFSVISGVDRQDMSVDGINPYLTATHADVGSLARALSGRGYQTTCVHPNSAQFFARDRVMPHLGFARFIDGPEFEKAPRHGPFVSDRAVGDRVAALLEGADSPQFIFAITIEAHGPWKKKRLAGLPWPKDASPLPRILTKGGPDGHFAAYARHLRHTDELLGRLANALGALPRPAVLAVYGDHPGCQPPGAPAGSGCTDFLVWRTDRALAETTRIEKADALPACELGDRILAAAGWSPPDRRQAP